MTFFTTLESTIRKNAKAGRHTLGMRGRPLWFS